MNIPVYQIDAFTDKPFSGNPAAVCPLDGWIPDDVMQAIAAEMNLSETAFFVPRADRPGEYDLRWFTPISEVELCGHATLATGHVVFKHLEPQLKQATFHTLSGALGVVRRDGMIELDFPLNRPTETNDPDEISAVASALGATGVDLLEVLHANTTVAVFKTQGQVAALVPDFGAVSRLQQPWVIATAPADGNEFDYVCRFFAPTVGINEDPATGYAQTILMPYWSARLGKSSMVGRQISKRGGTFYCEMAGDRVKIAGHVVELMAGMLDIQV